MSNSQLLKIDGRFLYYTFLAGGNKILENQSSINEINVFPVKDMDTGTNLASTVRAVLDNVIPDKSYSITINKIAEEALIGARGNSGVIFAQFLYGLSMETANKTQITYHEFAESLKNAIPYMYDAVAKPMEGTMLTVIKEWSDFISSKKGKLEDFKENIIESIKTLEASLSETTEKLKILSKYNLVDAGAKGFVLFIQGIIELIKNKSIRSINRSSNITITSIHSEELIHENITFRYCTEAIIRNLSINKNELKYQLENNGDSVVIAGSDKLCRIHIHTDNPSKMFYNLSKHGTITYQKVDDMVRQMEAASSRKWNIAIVTDSSCDLPQELIDEYQINYVPININFGDNHYLDKMTIMPEEFYKLLESSEEFPKTSQINERSFTNIYSHLASHYDAIIGIHLTSQFSGTYNSSKKAAERISNEFNKPIHVFDSKTLSGALGLIVLKTAKAIEKGDSLEEITNNIPKWSSESKIFVSVRDLKYMIKGGRVSKSKGFIASLLGVNPIVSMDKDGKSMLMGKAFSQKSNMDKVVKHIKKTSLSQEISDYIVLHANNDEGADYYSQKMETLTGMKPISKVNISPVIGMNAGIGTTAVSIIYK